MSAASKIRRDEVPFNLYRVSSPGTAKVLSNERLTPDSPEDVCHIVLDLEGLSYRYLEGQSLGVLTPGVDEKGHANKLRLYSIASSRLGDDGLGRTASLCVKRVIFQLPETGHEYRGVASNYLCDTRPGDDVKITGPVGKTFLLPDDPGSNLILVATGTGIAPYRAFLRRIFHELPGWTGRVFLFFGIRTAAECLYRAELESYLEFPNVRLCYAISREQQTADGQRMYVDHRMAEQLEDLWRLLDRDDTYLYICGIKGMEDRIFGLLQQRAHADGISWGAFHRMLVETGRLLVETY
jgi:ferredoxin--NADP+ reductase